MIAAALAALAFSCHIGGAPPFQAPDQGCTPGAFAHVPSKAEACTPRLHPRDTVTAAMRRRVIRRYGLDPKTFKGEADHRVPVFLLGRSTLGNLFPEAGPIPNPKDKLEFYVFRRICHDDPAPMRPRTGIHIFLGDWRSAYNFYIRDRQ